MKGVKALALLVVALSAAPSFGKQPMGFIKVEGVQGSSKDPAHAGWIDLYSFGFQSPNSPASPACFASNMASFVIAAPPTAGSGEAKLSQMCRAHTPVSLMRVDILGSAAGPHLLHNVQFTSCKNAGDPVDSDSEAIRYSECSNHHAPPPAR